MTDIALVGCGRIVFEAYLDAFRAVSDRLRVRVVCDLSEARAREAAVALSVVGKPVVATNDPDHPLLVQAALTILALPPDAGTRLARKTLARGQHVLAEKPLTTDAATLNELDKLAKRNSAWLGIVTNYLYRPDLKLAIGLIKDGWIGVPTWVRFHMASDGHWAGIDGYDPDWRIDHGRMPGGVAADKGYHLLYMAEAVCGAPIVDCQWRVAGSGSTTLSTWMAQTGHANDASCSLAVSWASHGQATDVMEIHGTDGSLYLDPAMATPLRLVRADGSVTEVLYPKQDLWGYQGMFLAAARSATEGGLTNLSGPRRWAAIVDAAARSWPGTSSALAVIQHDDECAPRADYG